MHPFDTLLEKAKAAHYHWTVNNQQMTQVKAMSELGDAIQDAEATRSILANFKVLECRAFKVTSYIGDKQVMLVCLDLDEKGEPYFTIELRTLTKTPQNYVFDGIIRRGEGYYYITRSYTIKFSDWPLLLRAFLEIKEVADPILEAFNKKEKEK